MSADNPNPIIENFLKGYEQSLDYYENVARTCQRHCEDLLQSAGIRAIFTSRAKSPLRLREKLYKRHTSKEAYTSIADIERDIVDFAGTRIALYFPGDQDKVRHILEANFDVKRIKDNFELQSTPVYKKVFSGYKAVHYHVHLHKEAAGRPSYTEALIEIQVASVLMHAWAEVGHDLIYKPSDVALSEAEHAILDQLNGLVMTGEIALAQLQAAIDARASQPDNPFADHYELAMHLRNIIEPVFPKGTSGVMMGRVDILFRFLQLAELDRPRQLDPFAADLNPDTNNAPITEQIVDRVLKAKPELEKEYAQARGEAGVHNPYSSTLERFSQPSQAEAYGNFLLQWSMLENFVGLLWQMNGIDSPSIEPGRVVDYLGKLNLLDAETLNRLSHIRTLRNAAVHGQFSIEPAELNEATRFLERLMLSSQFKVITDMKEKIEQAKIESSTDPLTRLVNRRAFGMRVSQELAQNSEQPLSLLMIDLDDFKKINDAYGHSVGDKVLIILANLLQAKSRDGDVIARYGGDEICVLMPQTNKEQAVALAEHYRLAVEAMPMRVDETPLIVHGTISVGVSTVIPETTNWQQFFQEADEALYRAKQSGKNRVAHFMDAE